MQTKPRRHLPTDFTAYAPGRTATHLTKHYNASLRIIRRWVAETGVELCVEKVDFTIKHAPANVLELSKGKTIRQLGKEFGVGRETIRKWLIGAGVSPNGRNIKKSAPADFAEIARGKTKYAMRQHFGASQEVIDRWFKECGIVARNPQFKPNLHQMGLAHKVGLNTIKVRSIYDDAADTLRRERFPVNRCNDKGGFDPQGKFWRVGWSVLTADELLARAAKYQRVAA